MSTAAGEQPRRRFRLSIAQLGGIVALVTGVVTLVFVFKPGWKPQAPPDVGKATITDVNALRPYTFRRYLQRQGVSEGTLAPRYLARRGVLIEFHYEIQGLGGKKLPLRWELSDATTNDLVASGQGFTIIPSNNDEGADWSVWIPPQKPGRMYYATVTIYQPKGPPYELKHFNSPKFRWLAPS
jgi:hypothetical protein